jgi:hypothetical protein
VLLLGTLVHLASLAVLRFAFATGSDSALLAGSGLGIVGRRLAEAAATVGALAAVPHADVASAVVLIQVAMALGRMLVGGVPSVVVKFYMAGEVKKVLAGTIWRRYPVHYLETKWGWERFKPYYVQAYRVIMARLAVSAPWFALAWWIARPPLPADTRPGRLSLPCSRR